MTRRTEPGNAAADDELRNWHRERLLMAFGQLRPQARFAAPDQDYLFVLFTNRCGSNYLCEALASTGRFNAGGEFFNADTVLEHAGARRLRSVQEYFVILPALVGAQQHLLAKLAIEHVAILQEGAILPAVLARSRFILLERNDRLAQAISRVIASQNRQWTSLQHAAIPDSQLAYSRAAIDEELRRTEKGNAMLHRFLESSGAAAMYLEYEALVADPQAQIDRIGAWLDMPGLRIDPTAIHISRQARAVNHAWRLHYLAGD